MKLHHYLNNLHRIVSVWSEFSLYNEKALREFHFLICHKIFWAYLRQGLFKKGYIVLFPLMRSRYPHPTYLHFMDVQSKEYFNKDNLVYALLDECGFTRFGFGFSEKHTIYYFKEI